MTSTYLYHFITVITLYCKGPVITRLRDEGWTIALESTLFAVRTGIFLAYLIFVIFFTQSSFLENEIYTEKRQFFAINL